VVLQDTALWSKALRILFEDPAIGLVVPLITMPGTPAEVPTCQAHWPVIAQAYRDAGKRPLLLSQVIQPMGPEALEVAEASGLRDIIFGMDFGVRALGHLARWSGIVNRATQPAPAVPVLAHPPRLDTERSALQFLSSRGVPVVPGAVVTNAAEAAAAAQQMGDVVALKIMSLDIAHKTESGGVKLAVAADAAGPAFDELRANVARAAPDARIEGVIVSPMRVGGLELFVGIARDPDWGLAIAVGLGGLWVEILGDTAVRLLPIDEAAAREMLTSLRAAPLLEGYRGAPGVDLDRLAQVIVAIAKAAFALGPRLGALEINPLWARGDTVEALDALVVWQDSQPAKPHLQVADVT
jgi:acetate---CoA ligase (ADP-forming)